MADVAPPITQLTETACRGETRRCRPTDVGCIERAKSDGFERVSLYTFCRSEDVTTELTGSGRVALGVALGLVLVGVGLGATMRRRRRPARSDSG
jgi:hypothetical protein